MTEFERGVAAVVEWLRKSNFKTIADGVERAYAKSLSIATPADSPPLAFADPSQSERLVSLPRPETVEAYVRAKLAYDNISPGRLWMIPRESALQNMLAAAKKLADEVCQ